jgi:hypothetical protein
MQLYTSLVRLKQAMNGGQLPPMMPVAQEALRFIDPSCTPGLGALEEDAEKGLLCPVRGCGRWFVHLTRHLNMTHSDIGGASGVRQLLSIPENAALYSTAERDRQSALMSALIAAGKCLPPATEYDSATQSRRAANAGRRTARILDTAGAKNMRNRCVAQLKHGAYRSVSDGAPRQAAA